MNWDQVQGNWKQMQGKARAQWGELTDNDLAEAQGDREILEGKIQERYGKTKEEAKKEVDAWMSDA